MKPTFLIIGVMKSSTTSAIGYFNQHPNIYISWKELHFFNKNYSKGIDWYEKHFTDKSMAIGEKTPMYCFSRVALKRIKKHYPNIKLILFLRDPVTRAFSQFNHMKQGTIKNGKKSPYFININHSIKDRIEIDKKKKRFRIPKTILQRGFYMDQINFILTLFPRQNLKIIIHEHYIKDYFKINNELFTFIGVKPLTNIKYIHDHKRSYANTITPSETNYLKKIYKVHNKQLFKFLGFKIKEWIN